jgi:spore coat protein U-like protein
VGVIHRQQFTPEGNVKINYRVYTRATATSPWRDTGIIESDRDTAHAVWAGIIRRLRYHSYKLFAITYGVPIERP